METREKLPMILWSPSIARAEQDCACAEPDHGFIPAIPPDPTRQWRRATELHRAPLRDDCELAYNPVGRAGVVVLNRPAQRVLDAFAAPRTLAQAANALPDLPPDRVRHAAQQLATLNLLTSRPEPPISNPQSQIPNPLLTAWLHITDACNLRCDYCYLDKTGQAMDETTGRAAVEAVFRSATNHGFRAVKLKYAGGEPTLNFGLVRTLHAYATRLADQSDVTLRGVLLSNGVNLRDATLDWLRETGVRLMISLDGVGAAHDAQRAFPNGRGSFARVARNIDRAITRGVRPYLSITVTARNVDQLADTVAFALDRELLFNLNFVRENDWVSPESDLRAENRRLIAGVRGAFAVIEEQMPPYSLVGGLIDRAGLGAPHSYPCGAGRNYLVIDPRGQIARCQMDMARPVTDVWSADPLDAVRADRGGFQNVPVEHKIECKTCEWRFDCAGGCPLLSWRAGREAHSSSTCEVYRALLPEALRLESLRLLRHATPNA